MPLTQNQGRELGEEPIVVVSTVGYRPLLGLQRVGKKWAPRPPLGSVGVAAEIVFEVVPRGATNGGGG